MGKILFPGLFCVAALTLFMAGCEKDDEGYPDAGGLLPSSYIMIGTGGFSPASLSIVGGNSVSFVNTTNENHQVVSDDSVTIRSGIIAPQKSYYWKKDLQGTYPYHCTIHPAETGTLTLTP